MKQSILGWILYSIAFILFAIYSQTLFVPLAIIGIGLVIAAIILAVNEAFPL